MGGLGCFFPAFPPVGDMTFSCTARWAPVRSGLWAGARWALVRSGLWAGAVLGKTRPGCGSLGIGVERPCRFRGVRRLMPVVIL